MEFSKGNADLGKAVRTSEGKSETDMASKLNKNIYDNLNG